MGDDDERQAQDGARHDSSSPTVGEDARPPEVGARPAPEVDPFRLAIDELQEDLGPPETSDGEHEATDAPTELPPLSPTTAPTPAPGVTDRPGPEPPSAEPRPASPPGGSHEETFPSLFPREVTRRPSRLPGRGGLLATTAAALVCGLLGGLIAVGLSGGPRNPGAGAGSARAADDGRRPAGPAPGQGREAEKARTEDVQALKSQADRLARQVGALDERFDALPRPEPAPDLSRLRGRVDDLSQRASTLAPLPERVQTLDGRAEALHGALQGLRHEVAALRSQVDELTAKAEHETPGADSTPPRTPPSPEPRAVPAPAPEEDELEQALAQGGEFFRQGKHKEALNVFNKLELSHPDDARVWYYAALCLGFATNEWGGGTERLVEKGIEREQAGTPDPAQIDATFHDLSAANGKDWLEGYRKRARRP